MNNSPTSDNHRTIWIKKSSGEEEQFAIYKLERSLRNAGADRESIELIVSDIESWITTGTTTKQIYTRAFQLLSRQKTNSASRYKLKQAMLELGDTGYPFEQFIGQLFEAQGFEVQVGQILDGCCVTHEVDVIATSKSVQHLVECKYSQAQGKQVSVQVPLYVRSRMDDIIKKRKDVPNYKGFSFTGWVVTNTRFSLDSIQYGKCSGLHLLAWDYPNGNGLKEIIERLKIYPVTVLSQLSYKDRQNLVNRGIVSCNQLLKEPNLLDLFQLSTTKYNTILKEIATICG